MWQVDNRTPFDADGNWVRDKDGWHHWVVAVKATYKIQSGGRLELADEQPPPLMTPEYHGEYGVSSLRCEADITLMKPETDVIANAHAHAPKGRPSTSVPVTLRVDAVKKTLLVRGDSVIKRGFLGLRGSRPKPFVTKPIRYESAFGGTAIDPDKPKRYGFDNRNPVGVGRGILRRDLVGTPAPTILYTRISKSKVRPAGFGAIASYWSPRLEHGGTYDEHWSQTRKPLLPEDWSDRSLLCAPVDQQVGRYLRGGESIELENMTPDGRLRFELPTVELSFSTRIGRRKEEHAGQLVTVLIEPESAALTLVWQTALRVAAPDSDYLDETLVELRSSQA